MHDNAQYANNKAELSHQPTRARGREMRGFKSVKQAQRFLSVQSGSSSGACRDLSISKNAFLCLLEKCSNDLG